MEPDGVDFDPESIRVTPIRQEDPYDGTRITLTGHLGAARIRVQVDVGIGDAPTPEPTWLEYPSLLDLPKLRLRAYRPETCLARSSPGLTSEICVDPMISMRCGTEGHYLMPC